MKKKNLKKMYDRKLKKVECQGQVKSDIAHVLYNIIIIVSFNQVGLINNKEGIYLIIMHLKNLKVLMNIEKHPFEKWKKEKHKNKSQTKLCKGQNVKTYYIIKILITTYFS